MSFPPTRIQGGVPGDTEQNDSTNSAQGLPDSIKYSDGDSSNKSAGNKVKAVTISIEGNAIRYTMGGATPTNDGGTGLGHVLSSGDVVRLTSWKQIDTFQYISKVSGSHSTLQMTAEY